MLLPDQTESLHAAAEILSALKNCAAVAFVLLFGMLRRSYPWSGDYSLSEHFRVAATIAGAITLLFSSVLLIDQSGNFLILFHAHPAWGALVVVLSAVTAGAGLVTFLQHYRESHKVYGITSNDMPTDTPPLGRSFAQGGFLVGIACWALAIYCLLRISKGA
jgi:hypothetical protein